MNKLRKNDASTSKRIAAVTYNSEKQALIDTSSMFASKFMIELEHLKKHNNRKISQYRRIKNIRQLVNNPENMAVALRIDWSENSKLFQTRQEK